MAIPAGSTRRGRPPLDFVEAARAALWARFVKQKSGKTVLELERIAAGRSSSSRVSSGLWHKYQRGSAAPRVANVTRTEEVAPGSGELFEHPLWTMTAYPQMSVERLSEIVRALPEHIRMSWRLETAPPRAAFWRRPTVNYVSVIKAAYRSDAPTALCTLLALVREAELRQDPDQHLNSWLAWGKAAALCKDKAVVSVLYPGFCCRVFSRWLGDGYRRPTAPKRVLAYVENEIDELAWAYAGRFDLDPDQSVVWSPRAGGRYVASRAPLAYSIKALATLQSFATGKLVGGL